MSITRKDFLKGAAGMAALGAAGAVVAAAPIALAEEGGTGTATATVRGFGGDVSVTLTLEGGKVVDCAIVGDGETPEVGGRAVAQMPAQYVEAGSLDVDGVTGASVTSNAIKSAARLAYNEIMGIAAGEVHMKPGTYTAATKGYLGIWDLPVTVTVSEDRILAISVPKERSQHGETEVMLNSVRDVMIPEMIQKQSVIVDAVGGATVTSNAVKTATEMAVKQALVAGGSPESAIEHFYVAPERYEEGIVEEMDVDVLVVGMGTFGIMAMKRASERFLELNKHKAKAKVFGIEKCGRIGGQSSLTNEFNSVNPPRYIEEFNDGKPLVDVKAYTESWLAHTMGSDGVQRAKPEMVDLFMNETGKTFDWLANRQGYTISSCAEKLGQDFSTSTFDVMWAYFASNSLDKYHSGNEDRRAVINSYYQKMLNEVCGAGGGYMLNTEGYELIYDEESNTVSGVKARNLLTGKEYIIHAGAVIISTGGFGANAQMMQDLLDPRWAGPWKHNGNHRNDGKMIQAALNIGAHTWNIDMAPICMEIGLPYYMTHFPINFKEGKITNRTGRTATWTYNDIPLYLCVSKNSLAVGPDGSRLCNEYGIANGIDDHVPPDTWYCGPYFYSVWSQEQIDVLAAEGFTKTNVERTAAYCQQGGFTLDQPLGDIMYEAMDAGVEEGLVVKAGTLEELAQATGMDAATLVATVKRYNDLCAAGNDEDFGKDPAFLCPIGEGPFYAVKAMHVMYGSGGGLDVDTQMRVLKEGTLEPINGFYAIGQDSFGVIESNEKNYINYGGVCQGWGTMGGRLSGQNAADYVFNK